MKTSINHYFVYLLCSFLLFSIHSASSYANTRNPQIRTCRQLGGTFFVARSSEDEIGFCQFDASVIGALDLMLLNNREQKVESIENYQNLVSTCAPSGTVENLQLIGLSPGPRTEQPSNQSLQVCRYPDNSRIGLATLEAGKLAEENKKLNSALNL